MNYEREGILIKHIIYFFYNLYINILLYYQSVYHIVSYFSIIHYNLTILKVFTLYTFVINYIIFIVTRTKHLGRIELLFRCT